MFMVHFAGLDFVWLGHRKMNETSLRSDQMRITVLHRRRIQMQTVFSSCVGYGGLMVCLALEWLQGQM